MGCSSSKAAESSPASNGGGGGGDPATTATAPPQVIQPETATKATAPTPAPTPAPKASTKKAPPSQWELLQGTQNVVKQEDSLSCISDLLDSAVNDYWTPEQVCRLMAKLRENNGDDAPPFQVSPQALKGLVDQDCPVLENLVLLVQSLSQPLTVLQERLTSIATNTAQDDLKALQERLRANPMATANNPPTSSTDQEARMTFSSLLAVLGIAIGSTTSSNETKKQIQSLRRQQLLFYLCMDAQALERLLQERPAIWILEVGSGETVSQDSLRYYNTKGTTAFLPIVTSMLQPTTFRAHPHHPIVTISTQRLKTLLECDNQEALLCPSEGDSAAQGEEAWTPIEYQSWAQESLNDDAILDSLFSKLLFPPTSLGDIQLVAPTHANSVCALKNLNQSSWMNSVLQGLAHMPLLRAYLLSGRYKKDLNKSSSKTWGSGGVLLEAGADLLQEMHSGNNGTTVYEPWPFGDALQEADPGFSVDESNNAAEFATYFFNALHEDSNIAQKKNKVQFPDQTWIRKQAKARDVAKEFQRQELRRNRSFITDLQYGLIFSETRCSQCQQLSIDFQAFHHISLPIAGGCITIQDCLEAFNANETLSQDEFGRCPCCNKVGTGERLSSFWQLPDLLVIRLSKFERTEEGFEKLDTKIELPLRGLELASFLHPKSVDSDNSLYDLIGIVDHHGSMSDGHYSSVYTTVSSCTKDGVEDPSSLCGMEDDNAPASWIRFDDDKAQPEEASNVVSKDNYIVIYRRRNLTASNIAKYSLLS